MIVSSAFSFDETDSKTGQPLSMFFMLGGHITCSPTLYRKSSITLPMIYDTHPVRIGSTSIDYYQALFDESVLCEKLPSFAIGDSIRGKSASDAFLASSVIRLINLDPETKQPRPIVESYRAEIAQFTELQRSKEDGSLAGFMGFPGEQKIPKSVPVSIKSSYTCEIEAQHSELDFYFHVNQGSYVAYALNCAAQAAEAGALKGFADGDVCFRQVHTITNMYAAESFPGDRLSVTTWMDETDSCVLYFVISKDGRLVYHSKFVYHPANVI